MNSGSVFLLQLLMKLINLMYYSLYKKGGCICVILGGVVVVEDLVLANSVLITSPVVGYVYRKTKGSAVTDPFTFPLFIHN